MLIVDILILVILAVFVLSGSRNGFIQSLGQLVGAVLGFAVARDWSPWLGTILHSFLPGTDGMARFIAFVLIFIFVDRIIGLLFGIADKLFSLVTRLPFVSSVNALLGAIIGFAEGVVIVGASTYLVLALRVDASLMAWLGGSKVAKMTEAIFFKLLGFLL